MLEDGDRRRRGQTDGHHARRRANCRRGLWIASRARPVPGVRLWNWQHRGIEGTSDSTGRCCPQRLMPAASSSRSRSQGLRAGWWSDACSNAWSRYQKADRHGFQRNLDETDFEISTSMASLTIIVEQAATFRGRVLDPDGKPVAGATVAPALTGSGNSLTGDTRYSVETDTQGHFEAPMPASGDRTYNLVAHDGKVFQWRTWANQCPSSDPDEARPGDRRPHDRLTRPATVVGRVVDQSGNPVADREVQPGSRPAKPRTATTTRRPRPAPTAASKPSSSAPGERHIQCGPRSGSTLTRPRQAPRAS